MASVPPLTEQLLRTIATLRADVDTYLDQLCDLQRLLATSEQQQQQRASASSPQREVSAERLHALEEENARLAAQLEQLRSNAQAAPDASPSSSPQQQQHSAGKQRPADYAVDVQKYERLKAKYFAVRAERDAATQQRDAAEAAWRESWRQLVRLSGMVRVAVRVAPEGFVGGNGGNSNGLMATLAAASPQNTFFDSGWSASPSRDVSVSPQRGMQNGGAGGSKPAALTPALVVSAASPSRNTRVDQVFRATEPTRDVARQIVQSYVPSVLCGGTVVVCVYGGRGTARTAHAHEVAASFMAALAAKGAVELDCLACDADDVWALSPVASGAGGSGTSAVDVSVFGGASGTSDAGLTALFHERRNRFASCHLVLTVRFSNVSALGSGAVTIVDMLSQDEQQNGSGSQGADFVALVTAARLLQLKAGAETFGAAPSTTPAVSALAEGYESSSPLCCHLFPKLAAPMAQLLFVATVAPKRAGDAAWAAVQFAAKVRAAGHRRGSVAATPELVIDSDE